MRSITSCALWLLVVGLEATGLRMINLDAPEAALQGDTIRLTCSFELRSRQDAVQSQSHAHSRPEVGNKQEQLYAIKWYKDEREFFRYVAQEWQKKLALPVDGLTVDVDKSDNRTVVLANVTLRASGLFRCEVSTEAPTFVTMSLQRKMLIHSLPNDGPVIRLLTGASQSNPRVANLALGSRLELLCSAPESKPAAQLDWLINDTLNLSSLAQTMLTHGGAKPLFAARSQRFVRLPSTSTARDPVKVPNGRYELIVPAPPSEQMVLAKATQVDPNWPERLQQQQQTIELETSSLEQLAESASSWLNLTVDSNLLQLLSQSSNATAAPAPRRILWAPMSTDTPFKESQSSKDGHQQQFLELKSQPIQVLNSKRTKRWSGQKQPIASHKSRPPVNAKLSADHHKLTLKVRCSARVLHLVMSDEIKVRLSTDRFSGQQPRTISGSGDDKLPARMELMQSKGKQGNSATPPIIGTYPLPLTISVLSLIIIGNREVATLFYPNKT